ncbi:MAG: adenylate kinase [Planctomycetota bacterium JB042]
MRIVFLGPPGAGKGTQAAQVAARAGIPHISTGDMMRAAIASGTPVGARAKEFVDVGKLVPYDVMIEVVRERLGQDDCGPGFLLDGFPRTVAQAAALDRLLEELRSELTHVIELQVPNEVLTERLLERGRRDGRSDDTAEVIEERLRVYEEQTRPVSAFYADKGCLIPVDGVGSIGEIGERLAGALENGAGAP